MSNSKSTDKQASSLIRLNKAIADSGYCARRKADELIAQGKVKVNGETVTEMGSRVNLDTDKITIQGKPLPTIEKYYLLFHKPTGYVTSRRAGRIQKTIYELIPEEYHSVDPAGRLDQESSGLLILSNDGDFLYKITHPKFHVPKRYEVVMDKVLKARDIRTLKSGVRLMPEDKLAQMKHIVQDPNMPQKYSVELITGYNRQIRRSLAELEYRVKTLHRVKFGPLSLATLKAGVCRPMSRQELAVLLKSLSPSPQPEQGQESAKDKDGQAKSHTQQKRKPKTPQQAQGKKIKPRSQQ